MNVLPHIRSLDGVRGLAILLVLFWHFVACKFVFDAHPFIRALVNLTYGGVDLFFGLSGYLLTSKLLATAESPHYYRGFYIRRIARILPLYH